MGQTLIDLVHPQGMHKHFRMIAIADYLKSQGFGPSNGEHMRIPGIWKKLRTLYNLEALDERVSKPHSPPIRNAPSNCIVYLGKFKYQRRY